MKTGTFLFFLVIVVWIYYAPEADAAIRGVLRFLAALG